MSTVVATVLHDPNLIVHRKFCQLVQKHPDVFGPSFFAVVSQDTNAFAYQTVLPPGNSIITQCGKGIADARRNCLKVFKAAGHYSHILLVDFDRLLYWLEHDKASFIHILKTQASPFISIGRTEFAMNTHPAPQRTTERAINAYTFHRLFEGESVQDIVAGSCLMDSVAAGLILENSFAIHPGAVDVEWYAIARYTIPATSIKHLNVDGLAYEGLWLKLEPVLATVDIIQKRQSNLDNSKMMVDTIRAWRHLS